jgi:hypothetical protein
VHPFTGVGRAFAVLSVVACFSTVVAATEVATVKWSTPVLTIPVAKGDGFVSDLAVTPGGDLVVVGDAGYFDGPYTAFVMGISRSGTISFRLDLGASNQGEEVAVSRQGQIWVVGTFSSLARPGEPAPSLLQISPDGSAVVGQFASEGLWLQNVAVDGSGAVYVWGYRGSGPIVAKLVDLVEVYEVAEDTESVSIGSLVVDDQGRATIAGSVSATGHHGMPLDPPRFLGPVSGASEGFVARLSADGTRYEMARYVGGSNGINRMVIDAAGRMFVQGTTDSQDLPVVAGSYPPENQNTFVAVLEPDGSLGPVLRLFFGYVFAFELTSAGPEVGIWGHGYGAHLFTLSPDDLHVVRHDELASTSARICLASGADLIGEDFPWALVHPAADEVFDLRMGALAQSGLASNDRSMGGWYVESLELHASQTPDPMAPPSPPPPACPPVTPVPSSTTTGGIFHGPGGPPAQGEGCANLSATGESRCVIAGAALVLVALRRRRRAAVTLWPSGCRSPFRPATPGRHDKMAAVLEVDQAP